MRTERPVSSRVLFATMFGVALIAQASAAHAAPGDLDPTFGQRGRVLTNIVLAYPYALPYTQSIRVQPDGRILVCGRFWEDGPSTWFGTFIARYLRDGALDPSFGDDGIVAVPRLGSSGDWAVGADMVLQPDGKILLIGQDTFEDGEIVVQRYTSSGIPDFTFGDEGTVVLPMVLELESFAINGMEGNSIALQPDGKIVVFGWEYALTDPYYDAIVVFRLNADGSVDGSFGSAGTGSTTILNGRATEVLIQPGGKILLAGRLVNYARGVPPTPLLARYNADGSPDSSFGTAGTVTHRINDVNSGYESVALQPNGQVLAVGTTSTSQCPSFAVRYDTDGSLDTAFGANGVVCFDSSFLQSVRTVMVNPNGTVLVMGNAIDPASAGNAFAIVRLKSDGSVDPSFGEGGRSVLPVLDADGTSYARATNATMQLDGRILIAAYFSGEKTIAVIRVNGRGRSTPFERIQEDREGFRDLRQRGVPEARTR